GRGGHSSLSSPPEAGGDSGGLLLHTAWLRRVDVDFGWRSGPAAQYGWPGQCRSVVVAAAADAVSHPSHHGQYQAHDEQDDADDQNNMGEGEGRDEAREHEPQNDEDDSENDHDGYLIS